MFQKDSLGLQEAIRCTEAVWAAAQAAADRLAVAVADENGELVYLTRADRAGADGLRQAVRRAYTAAFIGRDTNQFAQQLAEDGRALADWADPLLTTLPGGVTIRARGQVVGAVGVSGAGEQRDGQLAAIGASAVEPPAAGGSERQLP